MGRVLDFLLSPDGALTAFLACALWVWARPRSSSARRIVLVIAVLYTLAGTYVVPQTLVRVWTRSYRPFEAGDVTRRPVAIVVLGGGEAGIAGWSGRMFQMDEVEAARAFEASRVFKLVSPEWVVTSGGNAPTDVTAEPSGIMVGNALVRFGVPLERILVESRAQSTYENAALAAPMLRERHVDQVIVVTSQVHMPRAMGAFRAAGLKPIPAIAPDPDWFKPWNERWFPAGRGLYMTAQLAHEVAGVPYYWMRGWWVPTSSKS